MENELTTLEITYIELLIKDRKREIEEIREILKSEDTHKEELAIYESTLSKLKKQFERRCTKNDQ